MYDELQKWLKSPVPQPKKLLPGVPPLNQIQQSKGLNEGKWKQKSKAKEVDQKVASNVPNVANTTPLLPGVYLVGEYALDVATIAGLHVQSLAYRTCHSPQLAPFALRFSPEQAYIDLGRLCAWDQWKVLWTRIGAHYYQELDYGKNE